MIRLLVLRHGPTAWNQAGRLQGRTDVPLAADAQAAIAGWALPAEVAHWIWYTSPLSRCQATAAAMGATPALETALIEMAWGDWEGQRPDDLRADPASGFTAQETRGLDLTPPGGESPRSTAERLHPWLARLHQDTVAVTHKGVIRALFHLATGWGFMGKPPGKVICGTAQLFERDASGMLRLVRADQPLAEPWTWPGRAAGPMS